MVLALSINSGNSWLDGVDAGKTGNASDPGAKRGPCPADSYDVSELKKTHAKASVKFSNIRYGQIGWTLKAKRIEASAPKRSRRQEPMWLEVLCCIRALPCQQILRKVSGK